MKHYALACCVCDKPTRIDRVGVEVKDGQAELLLHGKCVTCRRFITNRRTITEEPPAPDERQLTLSLQ